MRFSCIEVPISEGVVCLDFGRIYLIPQERMDRAVEIISGISSLNEEMVCISRMHPGIIRQRWPMSRITTYWLCEKPGHENVNPRNPSRVKAILEKHLQEGTHRVAILDGLEYISIFNCFKDLNIMMEELNDVVMATRSILLVPIDPRLFDPMMLARLRRFAELVL